MKAPVIFALVLGVLAPAMAKDSFDLTAKAKGPVTLQVSVKSYPPEGYIRETGDYSNGETHNLGPVGCGQTVRNFETWSRMNVGVGGPTPVPGLRSGELSAVFSLVGDRLGEPAAVDVRREVKNTLKARSHWKGQDFTLVINVKCDS